MIIDDNRDIFAVRLENQWKRIYYLQVRVEHSYQNIDVINIQPNAQYAWHADSSYYQEGDWLVRKFWFIETARVTLKYYRNSGMICYCYFDGKKLGSIAGAASNTKEHTFTVTKDGHDALMYT